MTRWFIAVIVPGGLIVAGLVFGLRWLARREPDRKIDYLIMPPNYIFIGADEALARRSRERRAHAEAVKREARAIETRDDSRSKIHMVNR